MPACLARAPMWYRCLAGQPVRSVDSTETVSSKCSRLVKVVQSHFYLFFLIFVQKKVKSGEAKNKFH